MAVTHHFKNDENFSEGGTWHDDYGRVICVWTWDVETRSLRIECGSKGRTIDALNNPKFGDQNFTEENLRKRLPSIAIEAAAKTNDTKYDV